ncbi:MAG TPA: asparagine synthetase B, partial [Phycisphaerae bacterium]|nr:asparagine synthetase B [Phycisphaerae bacterium]
MPGIVGLCDFRRDDEELGKLLDSMSDSLCHETWYHTDRYVSAPLAMGRVSLGLLNPEPQPIFNRDRTLCIVLDGELYDYGSLKAQLRAEGHHFSLENDAEFLLHWYEARGIEGLRELNGSFALAIWDSRTQTVTLASDRYGLRPLYYARRAGSLLFASEVKALLADPLLTREIDHHAVADFFAFQMLLGDKTFFSEIRVLP